MTLFSLALLLVPFSLPRSLNLPPFSPCPLALLSLTRSLALLSLTQSLDSPTDSLDSSSALLLASPSALSLYSPVCVVVVKEWRYGGDQESLGRGQ